ISRSSVKGDLAFVQNHHMFNIFAKEHDLLLNNDYSDTFKDLGINVPRVTELSADLIREKIYDGEVTLTVDDAEKMVRRILK
ncbi:MAG: hypothetical protein IJV21_03380, partial [Lachnospiraceae bacterium]|nr:hypothetical protein [Lachnospiraceae bacterium]